MAKSALSIVLLLVCSVGCGTSDVDVGQPAGDPAAIIPASPDTAQAVPGIVAWELYQLPDGAEVIGVDGRGNMLTKSSIHSTTIDSQGTVMVEVSTELPERSTMRLTARGDEVLSHEIEGQPNTWTANLVHDVKATTAAQPYGFWCALAIGLEVADCFAAGAELGLNLLADAACVGATAAAIHECSEE